MPECSNPVQCQMAKREECTCDCDGANHGFLRRMMADPETAESAEKLLIGLKKSQEEIKKQKRKVRRERRAAAKKAEKAVPVEVT